jgi:hypothetical protein
MTEQLTRPRRVRADLVQPVPAARRSADPNRQRTRHRGQPAPSRHARRATGPQPTTSQQPKPARQPAPLLLRCSLAAAVGVCAVTAGVRAHAMDGLGMDVPDNRVVVSRMSDALGWPTPSR